MEPDYFFSFVQFIFPIFFIFVFGMIVFTFARAIKQWSYNNKQPVLSVPVKVISKRTQVSHHTDNQNGHAHRSSSTFYFTTFEVESGDRIELEINGQDYGLIAEGDFGKLTFQGTRFHKFERNRQFE